MKVGDLVVMKGFFDTGLIVKIDKDFYGATQAFKIHKEVPRGHAIRSNMVDGISPTKNGIYDRVMISWTGFGFTYEESNKIEVISE